jgi:hypothetical protein
MEKETWVDIKGYEGYYMISSHCRVKSLERDIINNGLTKHKKEIFLKPGINGKGYLSVVLNKDNIRKSVTIHRLVYSHFVGELINGMGINHKDGNKLNCHYKNLEQITRRGNTSHGYKLEDNKTTSKYTGVCWDKSRNKWIATIKINGKVKKSWTFHRRNRSCKSL